MRELLLSALRGEAVEWPAGTDADAFLSAAMDHGIAPLLCYRLRESGSLDRWPAEVREALQTEWRRQAALDLVVESELPRVLEALHAGGVHPLLLKGTPLSATHYPAPGLRPRADTDLLIERTDLPAAEAALVALRYKRAPGVSGDHISHQAAFHGRITLDVHWKTLNPALLSDALPLAELRASAVAVPAFGPHAFAPDPARALLLACMHRSAHHFDAPERLVWVYDIHLLAQGMDAAAFESFALQAAQKQVRSLCSDGLAAAQACFATNIVEDIAARVLRVPEAAYEPAAQFLSGDMNRIALLKMDLAQLPVRSRLRLLREHLFPPPGYMLQKYNTGRRLLLPALYARRILSGLWRNLKSL